MHVTNDHIEKVTDSLLKACSDMNMMMRDTMNASLQSMTILTKGCEDMCDSMNTLIQRTVENSAQAGRAMLNIKNPNDLVDLQSSLMRGGFDSVMNEVNRMMQMGSRIAQEAVEPVAQNMNATIVKLSRNKAA